MKYGLPHISRHVMHDGRPLWLTSLPPGFLEPAVRNRYALACKFCAERNRETTIQDPAKGQAVSGSPSEEA